MNVGPITWKHSKIKLNIFKNKIILLYNITQCQTILVQTYTLILMKILIFLGAMDAIMMNIVVVGIVGFENKNFNIKKIYTPEPNIKSNALISKIFYQNTGIKTPIEKTQTKTQPIPIPKRNY
jgi:hypothetical protein